MAKRSTVFMLPEDIRTELEHLLIEKGFTDYRGLAEWLGERGFEISKSAIHRYGQQFEERVEALRMATHQAKLIVETTPDDEGAVSEALMRLVQEKLFQVIMNLEIDPEKSPNLGALARSIAELSRATVTQKKWQAEVREKAEAAAESVATVARKGGLSAESVEQIRRDILGIAST